MIAPELLVLGHVTRDIVGDQVRLGGAASYACRAAATFAVPTGLVTVAPADDVLLRPLRAIAGVVIHRIDAPEATTFELTYAGAARRIRLRARAPDLRPGDIPQPWRDAPVAYVGPVIGECDRALVAGLRGRTIVVGIQGWLRRSCGDGTLQPTVLDAAQRLPSGLAAVVLSELDHPDAEALAARLVRRCPVVAVTRGAAGVTLYTPAEVRHVAAAPAREVEPTGAGDVFGVVLALALNAGISLMEAATVACGAAARVVEGPDLGTLTRPSLQGLWPVVGSAALRRGA